ncbi:MAG: hydrogenase-4 component [Actinomycetota bacterium]|nr:hydrogenase-4 component [Actinomycetota bacterium]
MIDRSVLAHATILVPALLTILLTVVPRRALRAVATVGALATALPALLLTTAALTHPGEVDAGDWIAVDVAGGLLVGVVALVGGVGVLLSPAYLDSLTGALVAPPRRERLYYTVLFAFWATLTAVPLAGNLGVAWLLIEATTATSALLVAFSGKPRALEAGWKYLVLTSLGLGVALLGIVLLSAGAPHGGLTALSWGSLGDYDAGRENALVAYLLVMIGLAAKIGLAPVHNWLPDAHSEAPAPVSAMLSAALLPSVLLVAWRCQQGLVPVLGERSGQSVFVVLGLLSIGVAVPFLSRSLAWKRLLAYSSLEHMGVIALGIGFGGPLGLAGAAVHVVGHAVAKTLGFVAMTPLVAHEPQAARGPVSGIGRTQPALGSVLGLALGALSGLPPSPLLVSEMLIEAGGFASGRPWAAAAAAVLLALAFLGLFQSLLETTVGESRPRQEGRPGGLRGVTVLAGVSVLLLLGLAGAAAWLPDTQIVQALARGVS